MDRKPKTADGVEFDLGMSLYQILENPFEIFTLNTSPQTHQLHYDHKASESEDWSWLTGPSHSRPLGHTIIFRWWSSPGAAIADAVRRHLEESEKHNKAILNLINSAIDASNKL